MRITSKGKHAHHLYSTSKVFNYFDSIEYFCWVTCKPIYKILNKISDFIWFRGVSSD